MRYLRLSFYFVALPFALIFLAAVVVLESRLFSEFRSGLVEDLLTEQIGQPLVVNGDVRIQLGFSTGVSFEKMVIPSKEFPDDPLAAIDAGYFEVEIIPALQRKIDIQNIDVSGVQVNLIEEGEKRTWIKKDKNAEKDAEDDDKDKSGAGSSLLVFLKNRTTKLTDIVLHAANRRSGFEFEFELKEFLIARNAPKRHTSLTGLGSVNSQPFEISGEYPDTGTFTTNSDIGGLILDIVGEIEAGNEEAFEAKFELRSESVGDFLEVLRLERSLEGAGGMIAELKIQDGTLAVSNVSVEAGFDGGRSLDVSGHIDDLFGVDGLEIDVGFNFFPEDVVIPPAQKLDEVKIVSAKATIAAENKEFNFQNVTAETNAFDTDLKSIGPIRVGRVFRTPDGYLKVEDFSAKVGPLEAPYLEVVGEIGDVLGFNDVRLSGQLQGSSKLVLENLIEEHTEDYGRIVADFELSDERGDLALVKLSAKTVESEIWDFRAEMSVEKVKSLGEMDLDLGIRVPNTAVFLEGLGVVSDETGPIEVIWKGGGSGANLGTEIDVKFLDSEVGINLKNTPKTGFQVIRGEVVSEKIELNQINQLIDAITGVFGKEVEVGEGAVRKDGRVPKPLRIIEEEKELPGRVAKPLVLPKKEVDPASIEGILSRLDLELAFVIKELIGIQGFDGIDAEFEVKQGQMSLSPIEASAAGMDFSVKAEMDLIEKPDRIRLHGTLAGLDVANLLKDINLLQGSAGTISGSFDVIGKLSSIKGFTNSATGWATLRMGRGRIGTSLLDLTGLGVFGWLFSKELGQGYSNVVCMVAPVSVNNGALKTSASVLETESIQLLVSGGLNWRRNSIGLRAQPRKVNKPLTGAEIPIGITGQLNNPTIDLLKSERETAAPKGAYKPCVVRK